MPTPELFGREGAVAMRTRFLLISLFLLAVGIILAYGSPALAQDAGSVRVLRLSATGLEQAHSVAFSSDGKELAVGGISGIYLFDNSKSGAPDLLQTGAWAHSVAFVPGTSSFAAGLFDDTVKIWASPDRRLLRTLSGPHGWVRSISFSRDGSLVAAASDDNTIRVWSADQGSPILTLTENIVGIRSVALSPDGRLVAGAMGDKTLRIWSVPEGKLLFTLAGHTDWVRCVVFSPDGRLLASSGFDMTVRLWDVTTGQLLHTLIGHTSSVLGLSFSPDGTILASGSTDTTVRLWRVADGALLQVLRGHTGFVYSVAFSPDGKTLASGASDNTVRLWDVDTWLAMPAPQPATGPVESTTKDCRLCHHRQGSAAPPRVVEVPCEACHAGGIGQSWCVAFKRSTTVGPLDTTYHSVDQVSGVPVGSKELSLLLASPGNGETLYVKGDHMAPEVITGTVSAADASLLRDVKVHLDIIADGYPTETLTAAPTADGTFEFKAAINPKSPPPQLLKPSTRQCLQCHGDYQPDAGLPVGVVGLIVTATMPDGQQATDERWVRVDSSRDASLPVQVKDSQTGEPISGVSVAASTTLYAWRDRFGTAITGADGTAQLTLDDSSLVPLSYHVSIPPQVVNGVLYSGKPVDAKLQPGVSQAAPVTLYASAQRGSVSGTLAGASPASSATEIWAIQLPAGPAFDVVPGDKATFDFADLPVGTYLITPDLLQLAQQGLFAEPQQIDLMQSPQAVVTVPLREARSLTGSVSDDAGKPVAFSWLQVNGKGMAYPVDAAPGQFVITGLAHDASFITVNAPGYYSQSLHLGADQRSLSFRLVPEPNAQHLPWGTGQLVAPPETDAAISGSHVTLHNGWLWGSSGSQPVVIDVAGTEITIASGDFALESAAGRTGWLYLRQGEASVLFSGAQAPVGLRGGQMIALLPSAAPLSMDQTVVLSLHSPLPESPVSEHLQPTLGARVQNWLEKAGIGTLQTITFITYFLSLVALITIPLLGLFWVNRRRRISAV